MSPDRQHTEPMGTRRPNAAPEHSLQAGTLNASFAIPNGAGTSGRVPGNREGGHRPPTGEWLHKSAKAVANRPLKAVNTKTSDEITTQAGSENRRPGKNRKEDSDDRSTGIGRAGIALTIVLLVLAVIAGVLWEQNSVVRSVTFSGHEFTTDEQLAAALPFETGIHADSVNFMVLRTAINALPYIRESGIHMEASGQMIVEVQERSPVALLIDGSERSFIDADGVYIPVVLGKGVDVPLLYGFPVEASGDTVESPGFPYMREFLIQSKKNDFASATISEVAWSNDEGVVALSHENGVKLIFGRDEYEKKLRSWEVFYSDIVSTSGIESFAYVDFRYRNQIVTQKI